MTSFVDITLKMDLNFDAFKFKGHLSMWPKCWKINQGLQLSASSIDHPPLSLTFSLSVTSMNFLSESGYNRCCVGGDDCGFSFEKSFASSPSNLSTASAYC